MTVEISNGQRLSQRAHSSSFYTAMRILARDQRRSIMAVYGFCRAVDDIADSPAGTPGERLAKLQAWRRAIAGLYAGTPVPDVAELVDPVARYQLRREDFEAVIDGMAMDAAGDGKAPDWQTLDTYCDRVASAVGRLSVRIFGVDDVNGPPLAHHLGRALQLTNILRDIDEDGAIGRLYLPREALDKAGIAGDTPQAVLDHPNLDAACRLVARRARAHFDGASAIMDRLPRRTMKAPRLMASAYGSILDQLVATGWAPPRHRVGTDRLKLIVSLFRYGLL